MLETALNRQEVRWHRAQPHLLGWLLTSVDGTADAPELCTELSVAKSSMSVALQRLEAADMIERYRPPAQRRTHYRVSNDLFGRAFRAEMAEFDTFHKLIAQALRVVGDDPIPRKRLHLMSEMYEFMEREFPKLLDRWEREKGDGISS